MASWPTVEFVQSGYERVLDPTERAAVTHWLGVLSAEAQELTGRTYGVNQVPPTVAGMVLRAVIRWVRRPDGMIQSRAGDETLQWKDGAGDGVPSFTKDERQELRDLHKEVSGLFTAETISRSGKIEVQDFFFVGDNGDQRVRLDQFEQAYSSWRGRSYTNRHRPRM